MDIHEEVDQIVADLWTEEDATKQEDLPDWAAFLIFFVLLLFIGSLIWLVVTC